MSQKVTQLEYLEVFARTGHDALRALLIVSCGSVVTFLALIGSLMGSEQVAPYLKAAIPGFQMAITSFIYSIMLSLSAYALAFLSHAAYYLRLDNVGDEKQPAKSKFASYGRLAHFLTAAAMIAALMCILSFVKGGFQAAKALTTLVGEAAK